MRLTPADLLLRRAGATADAKPSAVTDVVSGQEAGATPKPGDAWGGLAERRLATVRGHSQSLAEVDRLTERVLADFATGLPRVGASSRDVVGVTGIAPGAATGTTVRTTEAAADCRGRGEPYVLVTERIDATNLDAALNAAALVLIGGRKNPSLSVASMLGRPAVTATAALAATTCRDGEVCTVDGTHRVVARGALRLEAPVVSKALADDLRALAEAGGRRVFAEAATTAGVAAARELGADGARMSTDALLERQPVLGLLRRYLLATEAAPRRRLLEQLVATVRRGADELFAAADGMALTVALGERAPHMFFPASVKALDVVASELGLPSDLVCSRVADLGGGNSKLGLRGSRWAIKDPELFNAMARALFEAKAAREDAGAATGSLRLVIPAVNTGGEARQIVERFEAVRREVTEDFGREVGVEYAAGIETAAGALHADSIAEAVQHLEYSSSELTETLFAMSQDDRHTFVPAMVGQGVYAADPFAAIDVAGLGTMVSVAQFIAGDRPNAFPATLRGQLAGTLNGLEVGAVAGVKETCVPLGSLVAARVAGAQHAVTQREGAGLVEGKQPLRATDAMRMVELMEPLDDKAELATFKAPKVPEGVSPLDFVQDVIRLVEGGRITDGQALLKVPAEIVDALRRPILDPAVKHVVTAKGIAASPGVGVGRIALSHEKASEYEAAKVPYVLVINEAHAEEIPAVRKAQALISVRGGKTSHAAMIASNADVPCVMNEKTQINLEGHRVKLGNTILAEGDWLSVDGGTGQIVAGQAPLVDPSKLPAFQTLMGWAKKHARVHVLANADTPKEAQRAFEFGASGVGLVRSEHMFFEAERINVFRAAILETPERAAGYVSQLEAMQVEDYAAMFRAAGDRRVEVRLLDPPLYEFVPKDAAGLAAVASEMGLAIPEVARRVDALQEVDSLMGLRGVRLAYSRPDIEAMQVRALAKAHLAVKAEGKPVAALHIMLPMINTGDEMGAAAARIRKVVAEVEAEVGGKVQLKLGSMIETPRAALDAAEIAKHCDFFSYGTNDLTQLTLGYGRNVALKFVPELIKAKILKSDPTGTLDRDAVARMIKVAECMGRDTNARLETGVCGGQGADPTSVRTIHQLGIDYVSVPPAQVPKAYLASAQAGVLGTLGANTSDAVPTESLTDAAQKAIALARGMLRTAPTLPAEASDGVWLELLRQVLPPLRAAANRLSALPDGERARAVLEHHEVFELLASVRTVRDLHRIDRALTDERASLARRVAGVGASGAAAKLAAMAVAHGRFQELANQALGATQSSTKSERAVASELWAALRALEGAREELSASVLPDATMQRTRLRYRNDGWDNNHYMQDRPAANEPMGSYLRRVAGRFTTDNALTVNCVGADTIPTDRPVIFAVSHRSGAIDRFITWAGLPMDDEKFMYVVKPGSPLDRIAQEAYGADNPYIVPADSYAGMLERAKKGFANGAKSLLIYPEGLATVFGETRPIASSLSRMAIETGAVIVPVTIYDSAQAVPQEEGVVTLNVRRPVDPVAIDRELRLTSADGASVERADVEKVSQALVRAALGDGFKALG